MITITVTISPLVNCFGELKSVKILYIKKQYFDNSEIKELITYHELLIQ